MPELGGPLNQIVDGSAALFTCMALYLIWWTLVFKPETGRSTAFSTACIIIAALAGILGVMLTVTGYGTLPEPKTFPNWMIVVGGLIVYVILMFATYALFKRPVTTELFLIVGWGVLELSLINSLYGNATYSGALAIAMTGILLIAIVVFMACYTLYYSLGGMRGWTCGMIPLIAGSVYQIIVIATVLGCA